MTDEEIYQHVNYAIHEGKSVKAAVAWVQEGLITELTAGQVQAAYYRHKKIVDWNAENPGLDERGRPVEAPVSDPKPQEEVPEGDRLLDLLTILDSLVMQLGHLSELLRGGITAQQELIENTEHMVAAAKILGVQLP